MTKVFKFRTASSNSYYVHVSPVKQHKHKSPVKEANCPSTLLMQSWTQCAIFDKDLLLSTLLKLTEFLSVRVVWINMKTFSNYVREVQSAPFFYRNICFFLMLSTESHWMEYIDSWNSPLIFQHYIYCCSLADFALIFTLKGGWTSFVQGWREGNRLEILNRYLKTLLPFWPILRSKIVYFPERLSC